jgi:hypothetical protein
VLSWGLEKGGVWVGAPFLLVGCVLGLMSVLVFSVRVPHMEVLVTPLPHSTGNYRDETSSRIDPDDDQTLVSEPETEEQEMEREREGERYVI